MITSSDIIKEVASIFNITVCKLKRKDRHDEIAFPRKVFIYACYKYLNLSRRQISRKINRDVTLGGKELVIINRHFQNNEEKWLVYWNKYQSESTILKQLIKQ